MLSVDRCIALKYPLESINYRTPTTALIATGSSWIGNINKKSGQTGTRTGVILFSGCDDSVVQVGQFVDGAGTVLLQRQLAASATTAAVSAHRRCFLRHPPHHNLDLLLRHLQSAATQHAIECS